MDRRQFVQRSSFVVGGASVPVWIARAFGLQDPEPTPVDKPASEQVRVAFERASHLGKPLLVFVVPSEDLCWDRGERLGALLNHGGRSVLLDIGLCEVICASVGDVESGLRVAAIDGEPMMLLIEPPSVSHDDDAKPNVTAIAPELPKLKPWLLAEPRPTWEERVQREDDHDTLCNERIAVALREALGGTARLGDYADRVRGKLTIGSRAALEALMGADHQVPAPGLMVRACAVVRVAAGALGSQDDRERLLQPLADAIGEVVVKRRIPGSKWATSSGCGVDIEGEAEVGVLCGMGHVSKQCERFLYFFTE